MLVLALLCVAAPSVLVRAQDDEGEQYRLRFVNQLGGAIEASSDGGQSWETLGKVTRPAVAITPSTNVISVAESGTVAGIAPEQLLLRLSTDDKKRLRSLRILAKGQTPLSAAITTDIPAKGSLFRCLAPPTGSKVLLEGDGGAVPLPVGWMPRVGDRLVIVVAKQPPGDPPTIVIENKEGGEVLLTTTGGLPQIVGKVKRPLKGIGRYAGTERAGAGAVAAWSPTTVVVSTAGVMRRAGEAGAAGEERGGFVIQPAEPQLRGATHSASQLLLEALPEGEIKPAISRFFGIPASVSTGDPLDLLPTLVEVRIDDGEWEALPDLRGTINEETMPRALAEALGGDRKVERGITHFRVRLGTSTPAGFRRRLLLAVTPLADQVQRGNVTISADVMGDGVEYVSFLLDGVQKKVTNQRPFAWEWDTRKFANGEHLIEIRGLDDKLTPLTTALTKVLVDN